MGLVLGVWKGETIFVEQDWFRVVEVTGPQEFILENEDGTAYTVEADSVYGPGQEIIPEVFVKAAPPRANLPKFQARLYIEAPRNMLIMRERAYKATEVLVRARALIERLEIRVTTDIVEREFGGEITEVLDAIEREIRQNRRKDRPKR